jgi:hypothetical protein
MITQSSLGDLNISTFSADTAHSVHCCKKSKTATQTTLNAESTRPAYCGGCLHYSHFKCKVFAINRKPYDVSCHHGTKHIGNL